MNRLLKLLPAAAAVATATVGLPAAAEASSDPAGAAVAQPAVTAYCVYQIHAAGGLTLRQYARSNSTALRWIPNGTLVNGPCRVVPGGSYNACGGSSNFWTQLYYSGATGWGASRCVQFLG